MDDSVQLILRKVIAVGTAVMMVVTLAAIAVVKADHDKAKATNVASGNNANSSSDYGSTGGDQTQGGDSWLVSSLLPQLRRPPNGPGACHRFTSPRCG